MSGSKHLPHPQRRDLQDVHGKFRYQRSSVVASKFTTFPHLTIIKIASRRRILSGAKLVRKEVSADGDKTQTFVVFDSLPDCWEANVRFD